MVYLLNITWNEYFKSIGILLPLYYSALYIIYKIKPKQLQKAEIVQNKILSEIPINKPIPISIEEIQDNQTIEYHEKYLPQKKQEENIDWNYDVKIPVNEELAFRDELVSIEDKKIQSNPTVTKDVTTKTVKKKVTRKPKLKIDLPFED